MTTTRYYFDQSATGPAGITVPWSAAWNTTPTDTTYQRRTLRTTPPSGSINGGSASRPAVRPNSTAAVQLTTPSLSAPTSYAGTWRAVIQCSYIGTAYLRYIIKLVSADGLTVRAVLADKVGPQVADGSTSVARTISGTLTPASAQAGDRLVVEVGFNGVTGLGGSVGWAGHNLSTTSDLPFADASGATVADKRPWLELILDTPPQPPTDLAVIPEVISAAVSWGPPSSGPTPTGYSVSLDGAAPVNVGNVGGYTLTGLAPSTTYTVEVRTLTSTGVSAPTTRTFTTAAPPPTDDRFWTNRLATALGLVDKQPIVEVRRWAGGSYDLDVDLSHALAGYTITYGRVGATGPADPIKATLTLSTRYAGPTPESGTRLQVALCEPVRIALGLSSAARFTGEVTDPSVNHASRTTTLVCIGRLGRGNRIPVDGTAWPVESDGARVPRILEEAVGGLWVSGIDPGTAVLAPPTRVEPAVKLLDNAINSTGGQVVEGTGGVVAWHDANHRRGVNPSLTLSAGEVFRSITWAQRVGDVVNDVTVKTASGDTVRVVDDLSADRETGYGPYPASVDTDLVDEEDAYALGTLLVGRRARPAWTLPDVQVDLLRTIGLDDLGPVLDLRHGDRVLLDGLPIGCPVPPKVFVEGWTETATPTSWRLVVNVSDPMLSGVSPRYMDVPATDAYQYLDIDPAMRYIDVARTEDPAELL